MASDQMHITDEIRPEDILADIADDDGSSISALQVEQMELDDDRSKSSESPSSSESCSLSSSSHSSSNSSNGRYSEISGAGDKDNKKHRRLDFSNIDEFKSLSPENGVNSADKDQDIVGCVDNEDSLVGSGQQFVNEDLLEEGDASENVVPSVGNDLDNVTVKLVTIPDDDDLFDFSNLPNHSQLLADGSLQQVEGEKMDSGEVFKGELYRYLTAEATQEDTACSDLVTPMDSVPATPLHSGVGTPAHSESESSSDSESDSESSFSDGSGSYVTDSSGVEADHENLEESIIEKQHPDPIRETTPPYIPRKRRTRPPAKYVDTAKPKKSKTVVWKEKTLEKLEKFKQVTEKWLKDLEIPENLTPGDEVKLKIIDLNTHLTCGLCRGYLYEASTITECMHTFCKNCIVRHCMEVSLHCPRCSILIHPTDPFVNIRLDRMIQDIVYKLLPGVAHKEMENIKAFYKDHPDAEPPASEIPPLPTKEKSPNKDGKATSEAVSVLLESESEESPRLDKKYVRVTGSATIASLCNFLKRVLHLREAEQVEIFCCGDTVEEDTCTLHTLKEKFFMEQDCLMLLQYKVRGS